MKKLALKPLKAFNDNIWVNWVICEATLYLCYLCLVYCYCYCLVAILVANYFVTPWTVTCQTPLPTSFPRQEYWSGLPFPSPGDLPNPGIEPGSPALEADALPSEPPGKSKGRRKTPLTEKVSKNVEDIAQLLCECKVELVQ